MIMIQDDPMPTGADKPLRITGDPHKVQVSLRSAQCVPLSVLFYTQFYTFYAFSLRLKHFISKLFIFLRSGSVRLGCFTCRIVYPVFEFSSQQARELVVKLIRDKDQGDYRAGRADFGSKMGGSSLDVRAFFSAFQLRDSQLNLLSTFKRSSFSFLSVNIGGCAQICCWHHHWQEWRDDQEDSE